MGSKLTRVIYYWRWGDLQITKRFLKLQKLKIIVAQNNDANVCGGKYVKLQKKILGDFLPTKNAIRIFGCVFIGTGVPYVLTYNDFVLLDSLSIGKRFLDDAALFEKIILNENDLTTATYKPDAKRRYCSRYQSKVLSSIPGSSK